MRRRPDGSPRPSWACRKSTSPPCSGRTWPRRSDHKETPVKYMLMMNAPGGGAYQIASWPAADITAHIAFMRNFAGKLSAAGELVGAEGLAGPDQAKRVRAGAD